MTQVAMDESKTSDVKHETFIAKKFLWSHTRHLTFHACSLLRPELVGIKTIAKHIHDWQRINLDTNLNMAGPLDICVNLFFVLKKYPERS